MDASPLAARATRKPPIRVAVLAAASVAGVAFLGLAAIFVLRLDAPRPSAPDAEAMSHFVTTPGQRLKLRLKDGSRVELDGDTQLAVSAGEGRRVMIERGEAVFDVVHDPTRPFTVSAGALQVRVLGTAFDVERDGAAESVSVARGAVSASAGLQQVRVVAGQAARVTPTGEVRVAVKHLSI